MPSHFEAKLTTILSRQEMLFGGGGNSSLGLPDSRSNAVLLGITGIHCKAKHQGGCPFQEAFDKALTAREGGVLLASTNINPLPAKKSGVHRPCPGSEHHQTYPKCREREVHFRSVSLSDGKPDLDDCQECPRDWCPQACQQRRSDADRDETHVQPAVVPSQKFGAPSDQQRNGSS
jgi:hypothetical protein